MDQDSASSAEMTKAQTQLQQVHLSDLMAATDLVWHDVEARYRWVAAIGQAAPIVVIIPMILGFQIIKGNFDRLLILGPVGLAVIIIQGLYGMAFAKSCQYVVTDKKILIHSGVFWRKSVAVPFSRIQHIDYNQGPLERLLGLASCRFFTAGGGTGDPRIRGLTVDDAKNLRQYVLDQLETTADVF